uniref:EF-hand domain-containing protein n=1 Tax=Parascaris equorum TaxID=6256 RepID=A0A914RFN1_PAREQ
MDSDGDGFVEEDELREHIRFMQKRYVNNDVDRTEMVYGSPDGEGQELSPEYAKMVSRDERRWKVADYDSNGVLDRTEYGCFMHPEDCDHMRDIVVASSATYVV